ncbi:MAG: helix-turn-helix domain-containing protein [Acidobacteriota bacterium]
MLDVALRLFAEHGYAGTTIAKIEAALGLSPGAGGLFRHVTSKQDLLESAVDRALTRRHHPPPGPFASPAQALARSVLHLVDADPALWRLLLREGRVLPLDLDALYARLIQPAFDQAVAFIKVSVGDGADLETRVVVGISALLYLRVSQFMYGRTPANVNETAFVAIVERLFSETSHAPSRPVPRKTHLPPTRPASRRRARRP